VGNASYDHQRFIGSDAFDLSLVDFNVGIEREECEDGATGKELSPYRDRDEHTPPYPCSDLDLAEAIFVAAVTWELGAQLDERLDRSKVCGARRKHFGSESVAYIALTHVFGSARSVERALKDRKTWERMVAAVVEAWPDRPERRLPRRPVRRWHPEHVMKRAFPDPEDAEAFKRLISDWVCGVALAIGMTDPSAGTLTTPDVTGVLIGDTTWIRSRYNRTPDESIEVNKDTGEIIRKRLHDPDTSRKHYKAKKSGQALTSAMIRNGHPHEWLVVDFEFLAPGYFDESEAFTAMTRRLLEKLPGLRAIAYDMALSDAHINEILRMGLNPYVKVARLPGGRPATAHLGAHTFTDPNDSKKAHLLVVDAVDGCPIITVPTDTNNWGIPLVRVRTLRDERADGTWRMYGIWQIPDLPQVSASLVGVRVRIRHDSEPDSTDPIRCRALRTIPENDRDWKLFGVRNSIESMHSHLKALLPGRRFRNVGQTARTVNHCGYLLTRAIAALLAHHHRTALDLTPWFGKWRPPDPRWFDNLEPEAA
jgi:hypothetical protein